MLRSRRGARFIRSASAKGLVRIGRCEVAHMRKNKGYLPKKLPPWFSLHEKEADLAARRCGNHDGCRQAHNPVPRTERESVIE